MKKSQKTPLKTKDYLVTGEEFELVPNQNGDLLETIPKPPVDELPKYYQSNRYVSHTDEKHTFIEKIYQIVKSFTLKKKVKLITKLNQGAGVLLDFGCGTGDFLVKAKQKNWKVYGVEPHENARKLAIVKNVFVVNEIINLPEKKIDVLTLWHVLEHIPDVEHTIHHLTSKIKVGGYLIIAVPNFKSKDAKYYKKYWAAYDVPRHLWHFSKNAIKDLFLKHNLVLVKIKPMYFDAFYVSLLSEKNKTGKTNWINALYQGCLSNFSGMITKEYSSHIYILKKQK